MKEFIRDEEINQLQGVVIADMGDIDSLCDAFRGCHAITMKPAYWKAKILNFYRVSVLAKKLVPVLFFIYFKRTVGQLFMSFMALNYKIMFPIMLMCDPLFIMQEW